ncbi:MAG: DUF5615 family PIN-like protein [Candidatus Altiarchaeota archaeon]|nr:DUF5615 family PIN-like protein [Candidatus Altiarchaeota archaeon]
MSLSQKGLRLLCDENIPKKVVESLKEKGFDTTTPQSGSDDRKVAELSLSENRVLVTFDRHFANTLRFPPEKYSGIVFIRIRPPLIKAVLNALLNLFRQVKPGDFKGGLFVLSLKGYRVFPKGGPSRQKEW